MSMSFNGACGLGLDCRRDKRGDRSPVALHRLAGDAGARTPGCSSRKDHAREAMTFRIHWCGLLAVSVVALLFLIQVAPAHARRWSLRSDASAYPGPKAVGSPKNDLQALVQPVG